MHTNTFTQTNQHRDTLAPKKKKNTEIHKHTYTQTNLNGQTTKRQIDAYRNDRCLTGTIGARGSHLIGARGSRLIGARGYGSCLIGALSELGRYIN